jgi:hypothetical protein
MFLQRFSHVLSSIVNNKKSQSFFFWLPFIHSFICDPNSYFEIRFEPVLGSSSILYLLGRTFSSDSTSLNSNFTYVNGIGNLVSIEVWFFKKKMLVPVPKIGPGLVFY